MRNVPVEETSAKGVPEDEPDEVSNNALVRSNNALVRRMVRFARAAEQASSR